MMPSREEWLGRMVDALRPTFADHGYPLPDRIRVSCGWPSRSALAGRHRRIGEAWSHRCSGDGAHETFLSPTLGSHSYVTSGKSPAAKTEKLNIIKNKIRFIVKNSGVLQTERRATHAKVFCKKPALPRHVPCA